MFFLSSSYKLPWNLKKAPWIKGNHQFLGVPILVFQSGLTLVAFSSQVVSWVQEVQRSWTKLLQLVITMSSWNVESTFCDVFIFFHKKWTSQLRKPNELGVVSRIPEVSIFHRPDHHGGNTRKKNWRKSACPWRKYIDSDDYEPFNDHGATQKMFLAVEKNPWN